MKKIELTNGLKLEIDEENLQDMELLDDLYESQTTNPLKVSAVIQKVLGDENKKKLYDYIRDKKTGRVLPDDVTDALMEIFSKMDETKNS